MQLSFLRSLGTLVVLALLVAVPGRAQDAKPAGKRIALVIGNGDYQTVTHLPNPANDAKLIAATLSAAGFTLIGGKAELDLDKAAFDRAVQEFGRALPGADVSLFYYSGHGMQVRGENWLVPTDANPTSDRDLDFQMVNAGLVLRQMEAAGTKLNLVILDACRNNPFAARGLRATGGGLAEMHAPEGTLISYATQPGNVAADGAGRDSPYTAALAETIRKPGLDVFQVFNRVGLSVKQETAGTQQPWLATSPISGDFYFFDGPKTGTAAAAPSPPPPATSAGGAVDPDILFWQSIASSSDPEDYRAYLHSFPKGRFAELAQHRADTLGRTAQSVPAKSAATPIQAEAPSPEPAKPPPRPAPEVRPQTAFAQPPLGQPPSFVNPGARPPPQLPVNYGDELTDFGVPPQTRLQSNVGSPTPLTIPNGRVVTTTQIATAPRGFRFILVDSWNDPSHRTIPGAVRLPFAGQSGSLNDPVQVQLAGALARLTNGDFETPLVFFCQSSRCWESYNAALRAMAAGYRQVYWYRGGMRAWEVARLPSN